MAATFAIQIKMNTGDAQQGSKQVVNELDKIKKKALDVNSTLRTIFGVYAIKELIKGLYDLADSYTSLQNKLRTVTKDQDNLNGVSEATYAIAQRTRSSWETTAVLYQRMSNSTKTLGLSQTDLLGFTESLNKEIIVSGANSREAGQGVIQLSHAMASGTLQGVNLKALLKDLPGVADVIGKHFGVTGAQLLSMGKSGKITAAAIVQAFKESKDAIDTAFGNTIPTLAQSFEMLHNAAIKFFGEAGTGSGVLSSLAGMIKFVADHFETFGKAILGVAEAFTALYIINEIITLVRALTVAMMENPYLVIMEAVLALILVLRQFAPEMMTTQKVWTNVDNVFVSVGNHLGALWDVIVRLGGAIADLLSGAWAALTGAINDGPSATNFSDTLSTIIDDIAHFVITVTVIISNLKRVFVDVFAGVPIILAAKFDEAFTGVLDAMRAIVNGIIDTINKLSNVGNAIGGILHQKERSEAAKNRDDLSKKIDQANMKIGQLLVATRTTVSSGIGSATGPVGGLTSYGVPVFQGSQDVTTQTLPTRNAVQAQIDAGNLEVSKLKAQRQMQQDTIDELDNKYGEKGQLHPLDSLGKVDHAGLQASAKKALDDLNDTHDVILAAIDKSIGDYDQSVHDRAAKDAMNKKTSTVGTTPDSPAIPVVDPNAQKAYDKLLKALEALIKESSPVEKALEQIREAELLLDNPAAEGILEKVFGTNAAAVLADLNEKLKDQIAPLSAWVTKIIDETAAMHGSTEEEKTNMEVRAASDELRKQGAILGDKEIAQISRLVELQQHRAAVWAQEKTILENVDGATKKYHDSLEALNNLNAKGQLSPQDFSRNFQDITNAYSNSNNAAYELWQKRMAKIDPFGAGWQSGVEKIRDDMEGLSTQIATTMEQAFANLEGFIETSAQSGSFQWSKLLEGMEADLDKLAVKIIENYLLTQLLTGVAQAAGGVGGSLANAANTGGQPSGGVTSPSQTGMDWGALGLTDHTEGGKYASGGSYVVPGSGAPDSRRVMFNLSPGEQVDFTPPGQRRAGDRGQQRQQKSVTNVYTQYDPRDIMAVNDTPGGRTTLVQSLRKAGRI